MCVYIIQTVFNGLDDVRKKAIFEELQIKSSKESGSIRMKKALDQMEARISLIRNEMKLDSGRASPQNRR